MKSTIAVLLCCSLLAACGSDDKKSHDKKDEKPNSDSNLETPTATHPLEAQVKNQVHVLAQHLQSVYNPNPNVNLTGLWVRSHGLFSVGTDDSTGESIEIELTSNGFDVVKLEDSGTSVTVTNCFYDEEYHEPYNDPDGMIETFLYNENNQLYWDKDPNHIADASDTTTLDFGQYKHITVDGEPINLTSYTVWVKATDDLLGYIGAEESELGQRLVYCAEENTVTLSQNGETTRRYSFGVVNDDYLDQSINRIKPLVTIEDFNYFYLDVHGNQYGDFFHFGDFSSETNVQ